ncbi:EAL and HDOD domain-containing protein [Denitratisoma oestradiolicum]|uniref:Diguanylate phosphodiesterase n=1 Tax=Denitratisoma oestradiolicum TaxID=311182 RepID=A0A6S6Y0R8_9PROT|nr:EAL domain-containing protein [Denitratisoma oestradiolicum]TWO80090.1 diguanylate phosphodiesterase [Denitratisoma oestradiolicum]CAB1370075.1 Diguanylate phosphodiesterase [Denitratisoma oestradiolicum]
MNQGTEEIFIGRQPILDRDHQLYAYELLFRNGRVNAADVSDNLAASASVISHAFAELGIERALGPYKGFVNCDETLLLSDMLEILPSEKMVLEILETVEPTPQIIERCRDLKARGFTLALDDFVNFEEKWQPLLDLVEVVKVDIMPLDTAALAAVTKALDRWPLKLLAEKVDSREQADLCHKLGYHLFQGYFFAKPAILTGKKLSQSQLALMQLLGLVMEDADTKNLEAIFKREAGLTMNLMRLTNSVATGVATRVTSLRHAITVLGRRQLQRWLQLLLYTNPASGNVASPLLQMAAARGRLMELLANRMYPGKRDFEDRGFMTGIMSLMPTLMGAPMAEILKGVSVASDVQIALESQEGELGIMLQLIEALESGDGAKCHDLSAQLQGLDHAIINTCLAEAMAWASSIGQEKPED